MYGLPCIMELSETIYTFIRTYAPHGFLCSSYTLAQYSVLRKDYLHGFLRFFSRC